MDDPAGVPERFPDWNEYQDWCVNGVLDSTHTPQLPLIYPTLGLVGESGEFADKVKKIIRDGPESVDELDLVKELGDVLWYLAVCADKLGVPLSWVVEVNMAKLNRRREEDKIHGQGDNR